MLPKTGKVKHKTHYFLKDENEGHVLFCYCNNELSPPLVLTWEQTSKQQKTHRQEGKKNKRNILKCVPRNSCVYVPFPFPSH